MGRKNFTKKIASFLISLTFVFVLAAPVLVQADAYGLSDTVTTLDKTDNIALGQKLVNDNVPTIIGNIIGYLLSFVGLLFLTMIIYGGFNWMTAGGDEAKVKKSISLFTQAVFGMLIISAAYLLTRFIGEVLLGK